MKVSSGSVSKQNCMVCPFCESGELLLLDAGFARCRSCASPLLGSMLNTLRDIIQLPDALGAHACECDHPEMRRLPDGVFHCPACRSEVLPTEATSDAEKALPGSVRSRSGETHGRV